MEDKKRKTTNRKEYLFIPRKGQITISFLLIFVILFSMFALTLYASREMWASAKFKGAVDAAALSAGADMARGADLLITVTAVRVALFGISMILYIVSIPFPALFATANNVNNFAKEISKWLGTFSKYIPFIYTVKAEVDSYSTFKDNFGVKENDSPDDYGIVVVPTYSIKNLTEGNFQILPVPSDMKAVTDFLKEGVTVFGYRKYSYLEQFGNNIGFKKAASLGVEKASEWVNNHDVIIVASKIGKTESSGIDLSDVVKIDSFLQRWEGKGDLLEKSNEDKAGNSIGDILDKAQKIVEKVDITRGTICFEGNDNYDNSLNKAAVDAANDIKNKFPCSKCDNKGQIVNALDSWIRVCEGEGKENIGCFQYDVDRMKLYASTANGHLGDLIKKYEELLTDLENGKTEDEVKDKLVLDKISLKIDEVRAYANSAITKLTIAKDNLVSNSTCTYTWTDSKGGTHTSQCTVDFSSTISPMNTAISELQDIVNACGEAKNAIDSASDKINKETKNAADEVKGKLSDLMGGLERAAGAFKGFPGGKTIAAIFGEYSCSGEPDFGIPSSSSSCLGCNIPILGDMTCAFQRDVAQLNQILNGEKFEIASYYSAHLEVPYFLSSEVKVINPECKTLSGAIDCVFVEFNSKLTNDINNDDFNASNLAMSIGGTIVSGVLSGGTTVIIGTILTTLTEKVLKPLIKNVVADKVIPWLRNEVQVIVEGLKNEVKSNIDTALGNFIENYNSFQNIKLRLIGFNNSFEINWRFVHYADFISLRVAPERRFEIGYEENYSFA
jgi:hypothetical protein